MTKEPAKILLINSDLAKSRGDRAIVEDNIELIRERLPNSRILGISQYPVRNEAWYGIKFLDMDDRDSRRVRGEIEGSTDRLRDSVCQTLGSVDA